MVNVLVERQVVVWQMAAAVCQRGFIESADKTAVKNFDMFKTACGSDFFDSKIAAFQITAGEIKAFFHNIFMWTLPHEFFE